MADEITIRNSLTIRNGNLVYQSPTTQFSQDMNRVGGPTPGQLSITTAGEEVLFGELTTPGMVRITNIDATNFIEWGIWDSAASEFIPIGEVLPGEAHQFRFSRNLRSDYSGVGTGTGTDASTHSFYLKANTATCKVIVEAFEA